MATNIQLAEQEEHLQQALKKAFPEITEQKTKTALVVIEQSLDRRKSKMANARIELEEIRQQAEKLEQQLAVYKQQQTEKIISSSNCKEKSKFRTTIARYG